MLFTLYLYYHTYEIGTKLNKILMFFNPLITEAQPEGITHAGNSLPSDLKA